jgi:uncharacterized protein
MDNHYLDLNPRKPELKFLQIVGILLRLLGFVVVGGLLAAFVYTTLAGISFEKLQETAMNPGPDSKFILWGFQGTNQLFMFIVLPFLYVYFFNKSLLAKFIHRSDNLISYSLLAFLLILVSIPIISWMSEWNKEIHLPDFMHGIEHWAEAKEAEAKRLTETIAYYSNTYEFIIALTVIAILPALGEEFLFRGIIQNEFIAIIKNPHTAIWITGFLFSFMHFQFFGFIPRMLLGVTFGYLYFWSGNILIPILVHFLNNAFTLIALNLYKQKVINIDPDSAESLPAISIIVSLIVFSFLLFIFKGINKHPIEKDF